MKKLNPKLIIVSVLLAVSAVSVVYLLHLSRPQQKPSFSATPSPSPFKPYFPSKYQKVIAEDEKSFYQISYFSLSNSYLISIVGSPFDQYRKEAEKAFINQLNFSPAELCKLNVTIATSYITNPKESEKNYKLSFCP